MKTDRYYEIRQQFASDDFMKPQKTTTTTTTNCFGTWLEITSETASQ